MGGSNGAKRQNGIAPMKIAQRATFMPEPILKKIRRVVFRQKSWNGVVQAYVSVQNNNEIRFQIFPVKVDSMPIRVTCQCGQSLNVSESMAGKTGKCPKCQQPIRIPAATSAGTSAGTAAPANPSSQAKKAGVAKAKAPSSSPVLAPNSAASTMAGLLDQAGLVQKSGMFCPHCDQPSRPGTVLCTHCGFNFSEGTKVEGHKSTEKKQFGNKNLNAAAEMMVREASTQKRMLSAGTPWWMMFAMLTGLVMFVAGALIKMDAVQTGEKSKIDWMARIQRADWLPVMAGSSGTGMLLIAVFAYIAMVVTGFFESRKQGFLCLLVPLYLVYFMFSRLKSLKLFSTVAIFWITSILAGLLLSYALPKI